MSKTKSETIIYPSAVCSQCPYAALLIYLYNGRVSFCIVVEAVVFANTECLMQSECDKFCGSTWGRLSNCEEQMRKLLNDLVENNKCAGPGPARCSHVDSQQE